MNKRAKNKMAGKPKSMSQIKQLLLLHQQGKGKKTIARILGMSKTTVKVYLNKLQSLTASAKGAKALTIADLVKFESPVLEAKFHPGNPRLQTGALRTFESQPGLLSGRTKAYRGQQKPALGRVPETISRWVQPFPILLSPSTTTGCIKTIYGTGT